MKHAPIVLTVLICLAVGLEASYLQSDALETWYPTLIKSPLTPPNWVFPVVWTILYVMMGISGGLLLARRPSGYPMGVTLFGLQLVLNFLWSITFFTLHNPDAAMLVIILLLIMILFYIKVTWTMERTAALLFIPYALWVAFAAYLNLYVMTHN